MGSQFPDLKKILVSRLVIVASICIGFAFSPSVARSDPMVTWSQTPLSSSLFLGEEAVLTVTLNAHNDLGNIRLRVVPALEPFVSVEPENFSNVMQGDSLELFVTFHAPFSEDAGLYDGVVQVRTGRGLGRVLPRPLPIILTVQESGVTGADTDENGVWDYIDDYITDSFPGEIDTQNALRQIAKAYQEALVEADEPNDSLENFAQMERGIECLYHLRSEDAFAITGELESIIINNPERSDAYLLFTEQLTGQTSTGLPLSAFGAACETPAQ